MTDWRRLAKALVAAHGRITHELAAAIRTEFVRDGRLTHGEVEFLLDLRKSIPEAVPEFHQFVFHVLKRVVLPDAEITVPETRWLKSVLFADATIDEQERQFLKELKEAAIVSCPEFDSLVAHYENV